MCALGGAATLAAVYVASVPAVETTAAVRVERRRQIAVWTLRVLLAVALLLIRRTDWRKPTEADTPDLDRAVL